jgi:uncharacterized protein (DUF1697 family)
MNVYISLLRGINVGGNKKIRMADLKTLYESLGFSHVQTLLQSGNAVFMTDADDTSQLVKQIEDAIEQTFGFQSRIMIRTPDQLRAIIKSHPFSAEQLERPSKILVMFLSEAPTPEAFDLLRKDNPGPEALYGIGQELFIDYTDGIGESKLTNVFIEKRLKAIGTGRNWNTTIKLLALAEALETK